MNNNYFLKISEPFKKIGYKFKNLFKKPTEKSRDFLELSTCLIVGNLNKFDEFFPKKYDSNSFILLVDSAVGNGKLEVFKNLEEKAIKLKKFIRFIEQENQCRLIHYSNMH